MELASLLEWDTWLFRGARRLWQRVRPAADPRAGCAATLEALLPRLSVLAQAVAGRSLLLKAAEDRGGVHGPVLLLPARLDLADTPAENATLLSLRAVLSAGLVACGGPPVPGGRPEQDQPRWLGAIGVAHAWLSQGLPEFRGAFERAAALELDARSVSERLGPRGLRLEAALRRFLEGAPEDAAALEAALAWLPAGGAWPSAPWLLGGPLTADAQAAAALAWAEAAPAVRPGAVTERIAPPRDHVIRLAFDPDAEPDGRPTHSFEKVETLEARSGGHPPVDADDDLADHAEALGEVDLRHLVRGGAAAGAVYRADLELAGGIPDVADGGPRPGIPYPEWDGAAGRLRPDWVTVRPEAVREAVPGFAAALARHHGPLIRTLRRRLEAQRLARRHLSRQREGEELDLDAVVADRADRRAGRPASDRLYVQDRPLRHDRVTLVVLDLSLSSDAWVEDRRVLDLTREAVVVLGEVLGRLGEPLGVAGFASHTRHHCGFWTVKAFDTPWAVARDRLGALSPRGYTRIGPAVRHGAALLAQRPERHRLLVLITDGKPTDFDRYEGRHGREDVAHAVRAARAEGVLVHGLGLDASARAALPAMFGVGGWSLISHPVRLPAALAGAYARLTRG